MSRISIWDKDTAKKELARRLKYAMEHKKQIIQDWSENERAIYGTNALTERNALSDLSRDLNIDLSDMDEGVSSSGADVTTSYAFKNIRFIHSQLSSNPPMVIPKPTSSEQGDKRKAEAADKVIHYGLRQYRIPNSVDMMTLDALIYGTGFLIIEQDPELGDVLEVDEQGCIKTEGDINLRNPSPWNIYLDPDATAPEKVRWYFEKHLIPAEEAKFKWPEKWETLKQTMKAGGQYQSEDSVFKDHKEEVVEVYEYRETGLPVNGYLGRHGVCLADGTIIEEVGVNDHAFKQSNEKNPDFKIARLPLKIMTDVDVPGRLWGMSSVRWASPLQKSMNRLDSITLENAQAHGVARMILPEGAEIAEGSISNTPWDVMRITGTVPPHFMQAPTLMPQMDALREKLKTGVDDMMGVNESMFGQQSRETAGFAMQYATNQGNLIRYRLFKKLTFVIEALYKDYLDLVKEHWVTSRVIKVVGKGKALDALEIKGADIDGGYDLIPEYGTSFSLDPTTRKQEITQLYPLLKEAGIPPKAIIKRLQLSDMEGLSDMASLAEDKQRKIFQTIIAKNVQVEPRKFEDHANMLAFAAVYVMEDEYDCLETELKDMIDGHIELRSQMMAAAQQPQQAPAQAPMGAPVPGQPEAAPVNQSGLAAGVMPIAG